jgi:hypothetical protein
MDMLTEHHERVASAYDQGLNYCITKAALGDTSDDRQNDARGKRGAI